MKSEFKDEYIYKIRQLDPSVTISRTSDFLQRYADIRLKKAKSYELDRTKVLILFALVLNKDKLRPTDLSKYTIRTRNTITRALDELEKKGFVRRVSSTKDHRVKNIKLTTLGKNVIGEVLSETNDIMIEICAPLNEDQILVLNELLKIIRKHIYYLSEKHGISFL